MLERERKMERRRNRVRRQLRAIEAAAMILCGACFILVLLFGCALDGPNWELALGLTMAFGAGCRGFYEVAVWAHDKEL